MAGELSAQERALSGLKERDRRIVLLRHSAALLHWDQETYMPALGSTERSEQIAVLESLAHEELSSPVFGELLQQAGAEFSTVEKASDAPGNYDEALVRELSRAHMRAVRVPSALIEELARSAGNAQVLWRRARSESDFQAFEPALERLLQLRREYADAVGWSESRYDALLEDYEPFTSTSEVAEVFAALEPRLRSLSERIAESAQRRPVSDAVLHREFPTEAQERFGRIVLQKIGFDFDRGRLDVSTHPFSTGIGADDVRITTRYNPHFLSSGIFGTIHEAGHALYELGFAEDIRDTSLADGASLGIHESQSRFWENIVGRSEAFWSHFYPELQSCFPAQLGEFPFEEFYRAVNVVQPSLIRVEADEVSYGLHVILRFELEQALLSGDLPVGDLPQAWNDACERLLGIRPENDADGVLQDIHWSMGAFGYFPTYALGNLYSGCFTNAMEKDLGPISGLVAAGEFGPILNWLRTRVHAVGRGLSPQELCVRVTGAPLAAEPFLEYLESKYSQVYDLS